MLQAKMLTNNVGELSGLGIKPTWNIFFFKNKIRVSLLTSITNIVGEYKIY
jgi:hypothetical protein